MSPCVQVPPFLALSLERVKPLVVDFCQRVWQGGWTSAYWGGVWMFAFLATILFFRMLFTRWGDRDVMKKTLGLSLLVHMLFGMVSTHVVLGPGLSPASSREKVLISRVIVEGKTDRDGLPGNERLTGDNGGLLPGTSPAWEKMPFSETREVTRLERPHSETPDEVPARDRPTASESPVVRLPDVTEPAERADPFPEPDRQTAKVKAGIERSLEPIAE